MNKLPIEFKEKWLAALRSGEYEQCKEALHKDGGHCCLGVAEIVLGINSIDETGLILKGKNIPEAIKGASFENKTVGTLTRMNDIENKSFLEIADWIEANL